MSTQCLHSLKFVLVNKIHSQHSVAAVVGLYQILDGNDTHNCYMLRTTTINCQSSFKFLRYGYTKVVFLLRLVTEIFSGFSVGFCINEEKVAEVMFTAT